MTLGQYAHRESVIHKLDPRTKIISSLFLMMALLMTKRLEMIAIFAIVVPILFIIARLGFGLIFRNLRAFWGLFLLTFLIHGLFTPGQILWKIPFVSVFITHEGLSQGFSYALRIGSLIVLANLLTLTTAPMSLTDAIERFLKPLRRIGVPAHEIAMMLSISLRFIPILIDEAERIRKAQVSRGSQFEGHILKKIKGIIPLIIPLFLSTFRRAHDLSLAMDARCYQGGDKRTNYYVLRFRRSDGIALLMVLFFGIPFIILTTVWV